MIEKFERPLNAKERRLLGWKLNHLSRQRNKFWLRHIAIVSVGYSILLILGFIASDQPVPLAVVGLTVAAAFITVIWLGVSEHLTIAKRKRCLQQALDRNLATEIRIASEKVVEIEEYEDEGACYAFELPGGKLVFVSGQDFYSSRKFPNSDFSLIDIHSGEASLIEFVLKTHGRKLVPVRVIPSEVKWDLELPGHLEIIDGQLDNLEELLSDNRHSAK